MKLYHKDNKKCLGVLKQESLDFLIQHLEEEYQSMESMLADGVHPDRDYWLNRAEVERLRTLGADDSLLGMLEAALGENDEAEIVWGE